MAIHGFFKDDGTPVNADLIVKPSLCITCVKDGNPKEEMLCILNRMDQEGEENFQCGAYQAKNDSRS